MNLRPRTRTGFAALALLGLLAPLAGGFEAPVEAAGHSRPAPPWAVLLQVRILWQNRFIESRHVAAHVGNGYVLTSYRAVDGTFAATTARGPAWVRGKVVEITASPPPQNRGSATVPCTVVSRDGSSGLALIRFADGSTETAAITSTLRAEDEVWAAAPVGQLPMELIHGDSGTVARASWLQSSRWAEREAVLGAPLVTKSGELAGIVGSETSPGEFRVMEPESVRRFLERERFAASVSPRVLQPGVGAVTVEVRSRLHSLEGVEGEVTVQTGDSSEPTWRLQRAAGRLRAVIPSGELPQSGDDPIRLAIRLVLRDDKVVWTGSLQLRKVERQHVEPAGAVAAAVPRERELPVLKPTPRRKPTLAALGRSLRLNRPQEKGWLIDDSTVREVGAERPVPGAYQALPVGPLRSQAERFDRLRPRYQAVWARGRKVYREIQLAGSEEEFLRLRQELLQAQEECFDLGSELIGLGLKLNRAGACRCPDGTWHERTSAPCSHCSVRVPAYDGTGRPTCDFFR